MSKNTISKKTKWCFSSSGIGRDMACSMVSLFFITFIQYTCRLTAQQFSVLSLIMIFCRIWDAINDPIMSLIISNTKSRFGRFKPWILFGAISNGVMLALLFFSPSNLSGWNYVAYLGVCYLLWGMTFTMNDVSYWALIPHLAREKSQRDKLTSLVAVFASIGQFITAVSCAIFAPSNMIIFYRSFALVAASSYIILQVMLFITVEDNNDDKTEHMSLLQMVKVIFNNKQLFTMVFVFFFYCLGSSVIASFGTNFFYFKMGYDGRPLVAFMVIFGFSTFLSQLLFSKVVGRYSRKQTITITSLIMIIGYLLFFGYANVPATFFNNNKLIYLSILCVICLVVFAAQAIHYLTLLVMIANTIEYGEWQSGIRNEVVSFSIRPFMSKLSGAFQQVILSTVLVTTGLYSITQKLSTYELKVFEGEMTSQQVTEEANQLLSGATSLQILGLTSAMCLIPFFAFVIEFVLIRKKYIIDEEMYEKMREEIEARKHVETKVGN